MEKSLPRIAATLAESFIRVTSPDTYFGTNRRRETGSANDRGRPPVLFGRHMSGHKYARVYKAFPHGSTCEVYAMSAIHPRTKAGSVTFAGV